MMGATRAFPALKCLILDIIAGVEAGRDSPRPHGESEPDREGSASSQPQREDHSDSSAGSSTVGVCPRCTKRPRGLSQELCSVCFFFYPGAMD